MKEYDNVLPWPIDHERRSARYIRPRQLSEIFGDQIDLYDTLEERARIDRIVKESRRAAATTRLESVFKVICVAFVTACIVLIVI